MFFPVGSHYDASVMARLHLLLFPHAERSFAGERGLRIALRTVHIASMGILLGGHFFDVSAEQLHGPLMWTVLSGLGFMLLEIYKSLDWLFQVRGLITIVKVLLLLGVPLFWEQRIWILLAVLAIGSVSSHMPGRFRYYSLLTGSKGPETKG